MADEKVLKHAKSVYETACRALDAKGWKYTRHDEDLVLSFGARGEDLAMDFVLNVNPKAQVVSLYSPMPFKIKEEKRVEGAVAVSVVNCNMLNGSFDYDISTGDINFRIVSSFMESVLSEALIDYMVHIAAGTVDKYNDKFLAVSSGVMSLEQFIEWEQES